MSAPAAAKPKVIASKTSGKRAAVNLAVMAFAGGLVATMALPAYAFNPNTAAAASGHVSTQFEQAPSQTLAVAAGAVKTKAARDGYSATTQAELDAAKAKKAREKAAAEFAAYQARYTGPSVQQLLASPPNPNFSLASVYATASQYIGVPYVYGGATPAGFDCSGFVMFVYAQYGISMPHSVGGEAAMGTQISQADAQPGDLVVFGNRHIGFYAGNGNIMDAPDVGRSISVRPIWGESHYFVRIGI